MQAKTIKQNALNPSRRSQTVIIKMLQGFKVTLMQVNTHHTQRLDLSCGMRSTKKRISINSPTNRIKEKEKYILMH